MGLKRVSGFLAATLEPLEEALDWLVNGPTERCVLLHHPDDDEGRRLANISRRLIDDPVAIHAADHVDLDGEELTLTVGRVLFVTIHRPGFLRTVLWRARPVSVNAISF